MTSQSSAAQGLLRIGASEMSIEFVFDQQAERYRVIRVYNGDKNKQHLELHMRRRKDQRYVPLTGQGLRETQQEITRRVGLEYDTFINSAMLLQGRSDEFASKTPGERKEILARILNLGKYEALRAMAQERVRDAQNDMRHVEDTLARLAAEPIPRQNRGSQDELGKYRAYETYSGGEAFRINFALRIALSQLLATRRDTQIRMLVIDEGFGTQDPIGIQHLVQAIGMMKSYFDKVLVITYLGELKEAFPVHIEIRKHAVTGSQLKLVHA